MNEIIVVAHKAFSQKLPSIYKRVYVGEKKFPTNDGYRDDNNNNIADKNSNYCELTALYWYWKNRLTPGSITGLCHYRRYFVKRLWDSNLKTVLNESDIVEYLKKRDIILPRLWKLPNSVATNYYERGKGRKKDLETTRMILSQCYPEYVETYDAYLNDNKSSYCNMFISRADICDEYCQWLFDVLFKVEDITCLDGYSKEEKRIYGYLSELLLNVWVRNNRLRIKYMPTVQTDISKLDNLKRNIKREIYRG